MGGKQINRRPLDHLIRSFIAVHPIKNSNTVLRGQILDNKENYDHITCTIHRQQSIIRCQFKKLPNFVEIGLNSIELVFNHTCIFCKNLCMWSNDRAQCLRKIQLTSNNY